jgi:hypothetical protein
MSYSHANLTPPPPLPPSHQPTTYPCRLPMAASTPIPQPTPLLPHRRWRWPSLHGAPFYAGRRRRRQTRARPEQKEEGGSDIGGYPKQGRNTAARNRAAAPPHQRRHRPPPSYSPTVTAAPRFGYAAMTMKVPAAQICDPCPSVSPAVRTSLRGDGARWSSSPQARCG